MRHTIPFRNWQLSLGLMSVAATGLLLLGCEGIISTPDVSTTPGAATAGGPGTAGIPGQGGTTGMGGVTGAQATGHVSTPVSRLTNQEFVNSAKALLSLPQNAALPDNVEQQLAAEPVVRGLTNDSNNQQLTQGALAGYLAFADALTNTFLKDVKTTADLAARLKCSELGGSAGDLASCTRNFAKSLVPRAYRRDATEAELLQVAGLITRVDAIIAELKAAPDALSSHVLRVKTVIRQLLLSPNFLLLVERGVVDGSAQPLAPKRLSSFEIASRLAYFATASAPDNALLDAARQNQLGDPQVRFDQAQRLLNSQTGTDQFTNTLKNWLAIDPDAASTEDQRALTEFLGKWFSEQKPFSDFYQGTVTVEHVDKTQSQEPFGVLGARAFITSHSSFPTPGFIKRGIFVVESLLCGTLPDEIPSGAITGSGGTEVEVFQNHARQPCASCHRVFDNYGAALQQFDTETGLYDPKDQKLGTDFQLPDLNGISGTVSNVADLGKVFGASKRAPDCMADLWYRHTMRRGLSELQGDRATLDKLVGAWVATGNTSLKSLLGVIVKSEDFVTLVP